MKTRKLQVYVTEHQYRLLKRRAGQRGSIAAVVRRLIDRSYEPQSSGVDPFVQWVRAERPGSGDRSRRAGQAGPLPEPFLRAVLVESSAFLALPD